MKAYDYEAVAIDGAVYCVGCVGRDTDFDDPDAFSPIFADSEWDSYPVCSACGERHTYVSLTDEGVIAENADAVKAALAAERISADDLAWLKELCELWHGGQWSLAYAFLSSGNLGAAPSAAGEVMRDLHRNPAAQDDLRPDWEETLDRIIDASDQS